MRLSVHSPADALTALRCLVIVNRWLQERHTCDRKQPQQLSKQSRPLTLVWESSRRRSRKITLSSVVISLTLSCAKALLLAATRQRRVCASAPLAARAIPMYTLACNAHDCNQATADLRTRTHGTAQYRFPSLFPKQRWNECKVCITCQEIEKTICKEVADIKKSKMNSKTSTKFSIK